MSGARTACRADQLCGPRWWANRPISDGALTYPKPNCRRPQTWPPEKIRVCCLGAVIAHKGSLLRDRRGNVERRVSTRDNQSDQTFPLQWEANSLSKVEVPGPHRNPSICDSHSLPVSKLHAHRSSLPCPAHDSERVHGTKADVDPSFPLVPKLGRTLECCKLKTHFSASKSPIHMELRRFLLWKSSCKGNLVSPDATPHRRKTTRFHTLFGLDQPSCSLKTQPNDIKRMP